MASVKSIYHNSHYHWLDLHLVTFLTNLGIKQAEYYRGMITAHGDKCYCATYIWEPRGIPFNHGVAIYLLTYIRPYSEECRETAAGWISPFDWVANNYQHFLPHLPPA